jgi:hypothetical protein
MNWIMDSGSFFLSSTCLCVQQATVVDQSRMAGQSARRCSSPRAPSLLPLL